MNLSRHTLRSRFRATFGAASLALILCAGAAHAGEWKWSVTPYAWLTDVGVSTKLDGREIVDEKIPVGDLVKILDTIAQVRIEVSHGSFGLMTDVFDVTMSDEKSGVALPQGAGQATMRADIGMTIFDLAGTYDPHGDGQGIGFLAGTRILNDRATIDATFNLSSGQVAEPQYETNETLVDALFGVRYAKRFTRHFGYQMQADVSFGGTDYTWSVNPALTYAFGQTGRYAVNAGYRSMTVDYKDSAGIDTKMTLSGVLLGLRTSF
jgi:hypothetical protein